MKQGAFAEFYGQQVATRRKPEPNPVAQELQRRSRNAQRVLDRLRQGPATTMQLIEVGGTRAPGRVHELRQQGFQIDVEHIDGGLYRYSLKSIDEKQ